MPDVGRSQLRIKQFIKQLLHKLSDPVVSLLLRHSAWVESTGRKTTDNKLHFFRFLWWFKEVGACFY